MQPAVNELVEMVQKMGVVGHLQDQGRGVIQACLAEAGRSGKIEVYDLAGDMPGLSVFIVTEQRIRRIIGVRHSYTISTFSENPEQKVLAALRRIQESTIQERVLRNWQIVLAIPIFLTALFGLKTYQPSAASLNVFFLYLALTVFLAWASSIALAHLVRKLRFENAWRLDHTARAIERYEAIHA